MTPYWTRAIAEAKERRRVGLVEFSYDHKCASHDWVTCACGMQDERIPRDEVGMPEDQALAHLGSSFCEAVINDDPEQAERVLAAIERRAAVVLREVASEATS